MGCIFKKRCQWILLFESIFKLKLFYNSFQPWGNKIIIFISFPSAMYYNHLKLYLTNDSHKNVKYMVKYTAFTQNT